MTSKPLTARESEQLLQTLKLERVLQQQHLAKARLLGLASLDLPPLCLVHACSRRSLRYGQICPLPFALHADAKVLQHALNRGWIGRRDWRSVRRHWSNTLGAMGRCLDPKIHCKLPPSDAGQHGGQICPGKRHRSGHDGRSVTLVVNARNPASSGQMRDSAAMWSVFWVRHRIGFRWRIPSQSARGWSPRQPCAHHV